MNGRNYFSLSVIDCRFINIKPKAPTYSNYSPFACSSARPQRRESTWLGEGAYQDARRVEYHLLLVN